MEMYYSDLEECRRLAEQGDPYAQLELAEA